MMSLRFTFILISLILFAFGVDAATNSPAQMGVSPSGNLQFYSPVSGWTDVNTGSVNATAYGARGSTQSTTGTFLSGVSAVLTLASAIDLRAGDDISIRAESSTAGPSSPTSGTATPCGTPRSLLVANGYPFDACQSGSTTIDYYAVEDDGNQGYSNPIDIHIINGPASTTIWNDVYISMVPAGKNDDTAPIWKNSGAGDKYILAAQPRTVYSYTAGSGYTVTTTVNGCNASDATDGTCPWTATGGGCTAEPTGWVLIQGGAVTGGGVDHGFGGHGCTSAPTVDLTTIPGLANGGSLGSVTLSFILEAEDAGFLPTWVPIPYSLTAHPTTTLNDALIATIGALNGTAATMCQVGTGVGGVACVPQLGNDTAASRTVLHDWNRTMQNAINAGPSQNNGYGSMNIQFGCGTYDYHEPLLMTSGNTVIKGQAPFGTLSTGEGCVIFKPNGNVGAIVAYNSGNPRGLTDVAVDGIDFDGTNTTGAGYFQSLLASRIKVNNVYDQRFACPLAIIGANTVDKNNLDGNRAWGYGCATYSSASTYVYQSCCEHWINTYHNDSTSGEGDTYLNAVGGLMHDGYEVDAVATIDTATQCAYSNDWGHAYWLHDDTGHSYNVSVDIANVNQFIHLQCAEEYSRSNGFQVDSCKGGCDNIGESGTNGSVTGWDVYIANQAQFQWESEHIKGASLGGVYCDGFCTIKGSPFAYNSQNSHGIAGAYPALYIGPDATIVQFVANRTIEPIAFSNPLVSHLAPVQIAAANTGIISINDNSFWGNANNRVISDQIDPATVATDTTSTSYPIGTGTIVLASPCPAAAQPYVTVEDTSISGSPIIGYVSTCTSSTLHLGFANALFALGSGDTLKFFSYLPPVRRVGLTIKCNAGSGTYGDTPLYDCNDQIGGSAVPLVVPSSGTMGDNGAVTLTTALDVSYPQAYFYMPSTAIYQDSSITAQISGLSGSGNGNYLSVSAIGSGAIQVGDGLTATETGAATGSWTTGSTSISLSACPTYLGVGAQIISTTAHKYVGTFASCSAGTLLLTGTNPANASSGASDAILFRLGGNAFIGGTTPIGNCTGGSVACYTIGSFSGAVASGPMTTGSAPGAYYGTMTGAATAVQLYNNTYFTGNAYSSNLPQIPASPTAFSTTGPGAYTQQIGSNINMFRFAVPGYQLGPYDGLNIGMSATFPANTDSKSVSCTYSGYNFGSTSFTSSSQSRWGGVLGFTNAGATSVQFPVLNGNNLAAGGLGPSNAGLAAGSVVTSQNANLYCSPQLATSDLDYFVLRNVSVNMAPGTN